LATWVVNYDELLDRRQLVEQGVRIIRYKQIATQGRNLILSSRAPTGLLRSMVVSRLRDLNLDIEASQLSGLADRFISDANDVSGDIVLRAAQRGRSASELMGLVLSRYLVRHELGLDHYIGWYFLDDYADWLGQQEEQIADLLAMSPMTASDGSMHLVAVVTEAKYIDATNLATKRRESHKQLRDTLRRVAGAVMETPARLDCAVWLARLSDLLVDGVVFPASASLDLAAWRRAVRERQCSIELRGYSHVFVSGPVDTSDCTARTRLPEADGTSFDAYQEVFGRDRVRELVLCYHRQGDPTGIRRDSGEEGWNGGSAPRGPNEQGPGPRGTASARGRRVTRDEDGQGRSSRSREPDSHTEPDSAASGAGSLLLDPLIDTPSRTAPIMGTPPGEATLALHAGWRQSPLARVRPPMTLPGYGRLRRPRRSPSTNSTCRQGSCAVC